MKYILAILLAVYTSLNFEHSIHFIILCLLKGMGKTYSVTVDDIECAYFDQVEKLRDFGSRNKETIAQLVWSFFSYWAYGHNYASSVISVRTGSKIR